MSPRRRNAGELFSRGRKGIEKKRRDKIKSPPYVATRLPRCFFRNITDANTNNSQKKKWYDTYFWIPLAKAYQIRRGKKAGAGNGNDDSVGGIKLE